MDENYDCGQGSAPDRSETGKAIFLQACKLGLQMEILPLAEELPVA
jgi:hypothetical protein